MTISNESLIMTNNTFIYSYLDYKWNTREKFFVSKVVEVRWFVFYSIYYIYIYSLYTKYNIVYFIYKALIASDARSLNYSSSS